jgi:protein TonB
MVVHPLESSGRYSRSVHARMRGALPSIAVHAAIILVAVHATAHAALPHDAPHPPPVIHYVPTDPPPVEPATPVRSTSEKDALVIDARPALIPPLVISDHITPVGIDRGTPVVSSTDFGRGVAPLSVGSGVGPALGSAPFALADVDRPVAPLDGPPMPAYPEALRSSGIRGSVAAEFVVDTTGHVEPGSFRVLSTDSDLFSAAVRTAVLRTRFRPAEAGGHHVRQLVQESFSFVLQ